jgi:hypothetical protein
VEWEGNYCEPKVEKIIPVYHETNILGLQTFLWDNSQYGQAMVDVLRKYGIIS